MACSECGRAAADHDRFCGGCGAPLASTCRQCGRQLPAGVAFCTGCGAARAEPDAVAVPTEDRRRVSVLFVDLVDFTPYAERSDPEVVRHLQHDFYAGVRRVIGQYGGVVEKYIGDAVMALFGAPVATETDALRCVRAGLELQRVLGRGTTPEPGGAGMRFRVGVATGEALVDVSAAHDGGQAIVAGDVVNTAARLQAVASTGGVLVCGRTYASTTAVIRYAEQEPIRLRGRSTPTEVWLALEPRPHPRDDGQRDLGPLVGRDHELGLLTGALHRVVRDRTPQLITVFGQAGIGKSRLVEELRRRAHEVLAAELTGAPLVWHTGQCPPFGENVTYACLADIVKAEAGILDTDEAALTRRRLEQAAARLAAGAGADRLAEAERLAEALQPLVGLPGPHPPSRAEEAESAWRRFLTGLARRGPTVLVFEDLHWADEAMLRFIELLAPAARDTPLLLLCTARPELVDRDASWAGTIARSLTITLPPLRSSSMTTLCQHLLGQLVFTPEALRPLVELANGNPLYAQEYVRMLVERGGLVPTLATGEGPDSAPMPDSVHAVIANRLDLLDPGDRAVLQAAAVVGVQFWPGAVAAALGRPAGSVERSLRRLEQREFIVEQLGSTMAGEGEFRFGHVLVRDVCYQRLPRTERVARHERTAEWLEGLSQHRDTDLAEVAAHHRWAACEIARTVGAPVSRYAPAARRALYLAARRAYALHALDTAANHAARALGLLPPGPAEPDLEPERLRLELLATEISFYRDGGGFLTGGGADQLLALARRLTDLASAAPHASAAPESASGSALAADAARAWTLLSQAAWLRADHPGALTYVGHAIELFQPLPDSPEKVDAYGELARLHMLHYECAPAIAAAGTAAEVAERLRLAEARANAQITMATARYESGDPRGLAELREVVEHCRAHRLLALPRATRNLAHLVREEGDWPGSQKLLAESRRQEQVTTGHLGIEYSDEIMRAYFGGDLETIAAVAAESPATQWSEWRGLVACVRALRDEPQAATDEAGAALAAARTSGFRREVWGGLAIAALCRALHRRYAEATELLAELTTEWRKVGAIASGEWIAAAAFAAALSGPGPAEALREPLAALPRRTRWYEAALQTVTAAVSLADGCPHEAAARYLAAADGYAQIPAATNRMLALALAAAALTGAGDEHRGQAAGVLAELGEFNNRNGARGLLRIAEGRR